MGMNSASFQHFDTECFIAADVDSAALAAAQQLCEHYETLLNRFDDNSELGKLNAAAGKWMDISEELACILRESLRYCERTGGLFDITMGPLCSLWDFKKAHVPSQATIEAALAHVSWQNVEVNGTQARIADAQASVDLGGIAKGWICDALISLLKSKGATSGFINLGGNVACIGEKHGGTPWNVGIRAPRKSHEGTTQEVFASIAVRDKSVVTSGVYERAFVAGGRLMHHILDPRTGAPAATDALSVTVVSDKSLDGDGYTTALVVMGAEEALAFAEATPGIEALVLTMQGKVAHTSGIRETGMQRCYAC